MLAILTNINEFETNLNLYLLKSDVLFLSHEVSLLIFSSKLPLPFDKNASG